MEEIKVGEYRIPDDCVIKVKPGNRAFIIREAVKKPVLEPRCRDCKYLVSGYNFKSTHVKTMVCTMRPKTCFGEREDGIPMYYSRKYFDVVCDKFKPITRNERI